MTVTVFRDGKVHVRDRKCAQCLLGADRIVPGTRARELVTSTRTTVGGTFVCHRSGVSEEPESICAGWWDAFHQEDELLRLADTLGVVERVITTGGNTPCAT